MSNFTEIILASTNFALIVAVIYQRRSIKKLHQCPTFGCLSRQGIDAYWQSIRRKKGLSIVFLDVDNMHDANAKYGYQEVDKKLKSAFSKIRSDERLGRWYSGDELVLLVSQDGAFIAADRILQALLNEGLSATFGIVKAEGEFLSDCVKKASSLVQESKSQGIRGVILN